MRRITGIKIFPTEYKYFLKTSSVLTNIKTQIAVVLEHLLENNPERYKKVEDPESIEGGENYKASLYQIQGDSVTQGDMWYLRIFDKSGRCKEEDKEKIHFSYLAKKLTWAKELIRSCSLSLSLSRR